jgi:radical SAM protein with 4Fe4S-binding SPASM domain
MPEAAAASGVMRRLARRLEGLLHRRSPGRTPPSGPLWVELHPEQPHPIDLRWADEFVARIRDHVRLRPADSLLILVPNRPYKLNRTAIMILQAMLEQGWDVARVLGAAGDDPERRRELHYFFSDLQALLQGRLGEGRGRKAVVQRRFQAGFCKLPVVSEVALTYRCNLACSFCYAGCSREGAPAGWDHRREMSTARVRRVLEEIAGPAGCPSVSFTGGEPTLRADLPELVAAARGLKLKVNLISNGWLIDARLADALAAAGLDSAQLSLEAPAAPLHDRLVGRPGAFDRLWRALRLLRERGIRVHTNTTVNAHNLQHLSAIVDRVAEEGLERLTMNLFIPCTPAGPRRRELTVRYSEIGPPLLRVREHARKRGLRLIWYSPLPLCIVNTAAEGMGCPGCAAADGLLHVDPAGDVLPCSSFPHAESLGNLVEEGFERVWGSAQALYYRRKRMLPAECAGCPHAMVCQGACPLYWRALGFAELAGRAPARWCEAEPGGCRFRDGTRSCGTPVGGVLEPAASPAARSAGAGEGSREDGDFGLGAGLPAPRLAPGRRG